MKPLRLVFITRRYWPLIGGAENAMANLAKELTNQGHQVTILTAQWDVEWPAEIHHSGARVIRLTQPRQRFWGTWRYMQALRGWLRKHREEFDLVYVSMLKHDAYAAIGAGQRGGFPVIVRAEGAGEHGDVYWQMHNHFGSQIQNRCQQATYVVAPSNAIQAELLAANYQLEYIRQIPNGVPITSNEFQPTQRQAQRSVAEVIPDVKVPSGGHVTIFTGRLHAVKGLRNLVQAWPKVVKRHPRAYLWLVGVGPEQNQLNTQIRREGMQHRIKIFGPFDNVDEVLCAADLFVLPSLEEGLSLSLLEAMMQGLPVIATEIPGNQQVVTHQKTGWLVPVENHNAISDAVIHLIEHPNLAQDLGFAGQQLVEKQYSLAQTASKHLELFTEVLASNSTLTAK